jgi:trehalose 6-phosphate synthase
MTRCAGEQIVVVANREPYRHDYASGGDVVVRRSTGGLVTALEPLLCASGGVWVAHGSGTADRVFVDAQDRVRVPPANPTYQLRRVWLSERDERGYYYGFANECLWPLCHRAHVQPIFRSGDFETYVRVNRRFAEAACAEARSPSPLVLVQDYHFALVPQLIRQRLPDSTIVSFWHIPWPHPFDYAALPWGRPLIEGLLGSTIVAFQTPQDSRNFGDTVSSILGSQVHRSGDVIEYRGRRTTVRSFPVSVEWPSRWTKEVPPADTCRSIVNQQFQLLHNTLLGVGVDRLDYTKGIEEKFLAVERLLDSRPEFRRRFVFIQVAEPSRDCLQAYRSIRARIAATAHRINARLGDGRYRPIILLEQHHEPADVHRLLRAADVCYVGSLHDGMNLVAKEFVGARDDCRGVLVLSQFAGAARELTTALIVNPYAIDASAAALARALLMTNEEQASRIRSMRSVIARRNAYRWAHDMLAEAMQRRAELDVPTTVRLERLDGLDEGSPSAVQSEGSDWSWARAEQRLNG